MNIDRMLGKALKMPKMKGASLKKQKQWAGFPQMKRQQMRMKFPDMDGDRVPDKWDCMPSNTMRQDFTPFKWDSGEKAAQLSAAKRFGPQNIQRLRRIGQGRDRVVYALDKDKVLKVAKTPGGLTQNTMESDLDYPIGQIKHYETGLDYAVMERADPPGKKTKQMTKHLKKASDEAGGGIVFGGMMRKHPDAVRADFFNSPHFEASGLNPSDFSSHSVMPAEFAHKRQWGEKDGEPVLIDAGALMDEPTLSRYRLKHYREQERIFPEKGKPWQLEDWAEVQRQRRMLRGQQPVERLKEKTGFIPEEDPTVLASPVIQPDSQYPIQISREPSTYDDNVFINKFTTPGGKLEITEYEDGTGAVSRLHVDEEFRRKGIATNLLNQAKNKYNKVHAQVSNVPSVKTHFKAGFRLDENPLASEEETINAFEKASTGPGSIGMRYSEAETEAFNPPDDYDGAPYDDNDGDGIINVEDCEPDNKDKQGAIHESKAILYHGTGGRKISKIKRKGLLPDQHAYIPGKYGVFLTPSIHLATKQAKENPIPTVLKVTLPYERIDDKLSKEQVKSDLPSLTYINYEDKITPGKLEIISERKRRWLIREAEKKAERKKMEERQKPENQLRY